MGCGSISIMPDGKGIDYYKDGSIKYEGDFLNGKYEGKGKFIKENGIIIQANGKKDLDMVKGFVIIKMDLFIMKVIISMGMKMVMEKVIMMIYIIQGNLKKEIGMEKEPFTEKVDLLYMKGILLMVNMKEMEKVLMRMVVIIQANIRVVITMEREFHMIKMVRLYMKENI